MQNINAPLAWSKTTTSSVLVAVFDTGIDLKHPDLVANIAAGLSKDFTFDNDPTDGVSHGTHCAGTIAGHGNNTLGVAGVMWRARIFAVKIFSKQGIFAGDVQVIKGIDYALLNGAKVLSNSWGGGGASPALQAAIDRADRKGVLFIAAAGNGGADGVGDDNDAWPTYPACYGNRNIIAVMAIDESDQRPNFSNYGKSTVHLGAPGVGVISTVPKSQYANKSGTSMATPHVAGAAALTWDHPSYKSYTHLQIKALILKNTRPLADLTNKCVTGGTLDVKFLGK
jgi:subtilisin family serine protease